MRSRTCLQPLQHVRYVRTYDQQTLSDVLPAGLASLGAVIGFIVGSTVGRIVAAIVGPFGSDLADVIGITISGLAGAFLFAWLGLRVARRLAGRKSTAL